MELIAWILLSLSSLIAGTMIAAGIVMNRRSYRERKAAVAPSALGHIVRPTVQDELEHKRAA